MLISFLQKLMVFALHLDNPNLFPEPLTATEEHILIEKMMQGDGKAREQLIEHNLRLVAHLVKKYYTSNVENDELISIGTVGLIKAVNTYTPEKGVKLATYASRCIDNEILMFFRSKKKSALDVSFDEPIEFDSEGNPLTLMDIISTEDCTLEKILLRTNTEKLRLYLGKMENEREKRILIMRYGLDGRKPMTQQEIAKIYGISRSYVSRLETKGLKKLRKMFEENI